jgi:hypothetical protein
MELSQVIHYYIGQPCVNTWFPEGNENWNAGWILKGFHSEYPKPYCLETDIETTWTDSVKPLLRKIEDMKEDDLRFVCDVSPDAEILKVQKTDKYFRVDFRVKHPDPERNNEDGWSYLGTGFSYTPKELTIRNFQYLLSHGFDLFNLISDNQALNINSIEK